MVTLAQLHDPDSDPVLAQVVKMARARRDGLIPGLPKVIGVGDSLKGATVYYDDGSIFKNGVEVEQTRAEKELACYRAGGVTFDALVELWATRKFDPCPHATTPDEAWQMDEDGEFGGGPGTWDEIVSFMCLGLLTPDEYAQISAPCVSACAYHFTRENVMPRKRSLTSDLYWAARTTNNVRAASRGPGAYARRVVRRKTYSKSMGATGRFLRIFGLR